MIHYHGTPVGGEREQVVRFLHGRHALLPWPRCEDLGAAAEVCRSFCVDNGAFSAWKSGRAVDDWSGYYLWVQQICHHPGFDFAIVPDVIDGDERQNDGLIAEWRSHFARPDVGAPVWHLHESLERLDRLVSRWHRVCLGSSGEYAQTQTDRWWERIDEAMRVACDRDGRPRCKLHGLRMLDPAIFCALPLASADSTNAVRNASSVRRFGMYCPPTHSQRLCVIADRIEAHNSPPIYRLDRPRTQWLLRADLGPAGGGA